MQIKDSKTTITQVDKTNIIKNNVYYRWAFSRFFLNGDEKTFKQFLSIMPEFSNNFLLLILSLIPEFSNIFLNYDPTILNKVLNTLNKSVYRELKLTNTNVFKTNVFSIPLFTGRCLYSREEISKFHEIKKESETQEIKDLFSNINELDVKVKQSNINWEAAITLFVFYAFVIIPFLPLHFLPLSMLVGGSTIGNIIFYAIESIIVTFIAITISNIRNNIDTNKLFNMLFLCTIFSYFMLNTTLIGISSQIIFAIFATAIAYNLLNSIELFIKHNFSPKIFFLLSYFKDVFREYIFVLALIPTGETILKMFQSLKNYHKLVSEQLEEKDICLIKNSEYMNYIYYTFSFMLLSLISINLMNIIGSSEIYMLIIFLFYNYMLNYIGKSPDINMPKIYTSTINYVSQFLEMICSNTIKCFDHSNLIEPFINYTGNKYKNIIPKIPKLSTTRKYLNCPVNAIISIVQAIVEIALFPVFLILYSAYTAIDAISKNTLKTLNNHPVIITAAFIIISVISAVFASPIQLFVLSTVVMAGSTIMNILFGTMSGIISTTFATNAYVVINTVAMPYISSSFKGAGEAFNSFCESYMPCCSKSSKEAPLKK